VSFLPWRLIGLFAIVAAVGGYITMLTVQRNNARAKAENIQAAFDQYQAKVRVEGEAAKLRVAEEIARSEREKNETVATLQGRLYLITRDRDRLRDARAVTDGSVLPALPAGAPAVDRASFDRTILDRALQDFIGEIEGFVGECDTAIAINGGWLNWYRGQARAHDQGDR